jgi:hypothetical protein
MIETMADQKITWEMEPETAWSAAQAVVYRVGEPLDLLPDLDAPWSPALAGMLKKRSLPSLGDAPIRRRWVGHVCLEEPRDLNRGVADRPALVRFLGLARLMSGGAAVDNHMELGDPVDQAAVVKFMLDTAKNRQRHRPSNRPDRNEGAFFVGDRGLTGPHGMTVLEMGLKQAVDPKARLDRRRALEAAVEADRKYLAEVLDTDDADVKGSVGQSLTYPAAVQFAHYAFDHYGDDRRTPGRVAEALLLNGYLIAASQA